MNFTVLCDNRIRRLAVSVQFATVSPNLTGYVSPSCSTHCVYKFTTINVFGASTLRSTGSAYLAVAYFTLKINLNVVSVVPTSRKTNFELITKKYFVITRTEFIS